MRCVVCDYKYKEPTEIEDKIQLVSDDIEGFVKIEGNFIIKTGYYKNFIDEVSLYACPKCGTVKMEKWM